MFDAAEDGRKKSLDRLDGWQTRGLAYPAAVLEAVAERVKGWFPRFELRAG